MTAGDFGKLYERRLSDSAFGGLLSSYWINTLLHELIYCLNLELWKTKWPSVPW